MPHVVYELLLPLVVAVVLPYDFPLPLLPLHLCIEGERRGCNEGFRRRVVHVTMLVSEICVGPRRIGEVNDRH